MCWIQNVARCIRFQMWYIQMYFLVGLLYRHIWRQFATTNLTVADSNSSVYIHNAMLRYAVGDTAVVLRFVQKMVGAQWNTEPYRHLPNCCPKPGKKSLKDICSLGLKLCCSQNHILWFWSKKRNKTSLFYVICFISLHSFATYEQTAP